jgi:hypothetical protein
MIWIVPVAIAAGVGALALATSGKPKRRPSSGSNGKHPRSMRGRFIPREDRMARKVTKPKPRSKGLKRGSRAERSYDRRVKHVMHAFKPTVMVHSQFGGPDYPAKIVKDIGEGHVQVITSSGSRWEEPKANLRKWKQGDPVEER